MKKTEKFHCFLYGAAIVLGTMACSFSLPDISNLPRLMALAAALGIMFICSARLKTVVPLTVGGVCLALLVLLSAASIGWAANKGEAIYDTARWVMVAAVFLLTYNLYRTHPVRTTIIMSRAAAIIILVSVGMAVWQTLSLPDLSWNSRYGVTSFYTHKGTFSLLLLMATFPIVMRQRLKVGRMKVFYFLLLLLVLVVLAFLLARAALLALAVSSVVFLLTFIRLKSVPRSWNIPATIIFAILMGAAILGGTKLFTKIPLGETPGADGGILSSASLYERYTLWNTSFRLSDRHPLLGVGAGNWKVCYPEVSTADIFSVDVLDFNFTRPHNDYLRVLSEIGYPGVALLFVALASPLVRAVGRTSRRRRQGRMVSTAVAYFFVVLIAALVDFPFDRTETLLWCAVIGATLSATVVTRKADRCIPLYPMALLMLAVVLLANLRINSERQYPVITAANHTRMWNTVEQAAHKAQSPFCNLTPIGTPFAYYEAMAREQLGKPARETFAKALRSSPYHKQSLNDMARLIYIETRDADSSEALFNKAIYISPSFSYSYFNLAQLYLQENKYDQARQILLDLDLDNKQRRIDRLVWHYHTGETALYYQHKLVPAERKMRDQLLSVCSNH